MKINKILKKLIILLFIESLINVGLEVLCERMETISQFSSNFRLLGLPNTAHDDTINAPKNIIQKASPIKKIEDDLPDIPIYHQGWVKYFKYSIIGTDKPKSFFKNTIFAKQPPLPLTNDENKDKVNFK